MKNIVTIENNDLIVTLEDVATFSGNTEKSIKRLLVDNEDKFEELGLKVKSSKAILNRLSELKLNEEQTTFLMILMRNSPQVVEFKFNLVKQFMLLKDMVCESSKKQLIESRQQTLEAKRNNYGKERGHGFESAFRIISNCEADISTTDFNNLLYDEGIIDSETVTITNFIANGTTSLEDKGTVLVHTDTAEAILDKYEIPRKIDSQMKFDF